MTTQGGPYLAFAAGCGWGEAAELYCRHEPPHPGAGQAPELHCRHEPPHPSAGRVVSETRPWLRPLRSLAVLDPRGCPVTETLKCVIKVLKLYFWVHRTLSIFLINWFQWTVESAWGGRENSFRVGTGRYGPSHLLQPSPLHLKLWDEHKDECTPLCTPTPSPSLKREE